MVQLVVDLRFQPKIALTVLYPFKVGHSNAARVRQDVRDHEHPLVGQNVVRIGRRGTVRSLAQDTGLDPVDIPAGDLILGSGIVSPPAWLTYSQ